MKITDSPGAMLVMPFSGTAAAGDSELSSIFQPVMSTGDAPMFVTSNQSAPTGLLPLHHGATSEMISLRGAGDPARRADFVRHRRAATNAPLTPTTLSCVMRGVVQRRPRCRSRERAGCGETPKVTPATQCAAGVEQVDRVAAGAQSDAPAGVAADLQARRARSRRTRSVRKRGARAGEVAGLHEDHRFAGRDAR